MFNKTSFSIQPTSSTERHLPVAPARVARPLLLVRIGELYTLCQPPNHERLHLVLGVSGVHLVLEPVRGVVELQLAEDLPAALGDSLRGEKETTKSK